MSLVFWIWRGTVRQSSVPQGLALSSHLIIRIPHWGASHQACSANITEHVEKVKLVFYHLRESQTVIFCLTSNCLVGRLDIRQITADCLFVMMSDLDQYYGKLTEDKMIHSPQTCKMHSLSPPSMLMESQVKFHSPQNISGASGSKTVQQKCGDSRCIWPEACLPVENLLNEMWM